MVLMLLLSRAFDCFGGDFILFFLLLSFFIVCIIYNVEICFRHYVGAEARLIDIILVY
jgi:hypothetical protein